MSDTLTLPRRPRRLPPRLRRNPMAAIALGLLLAIALAAIFAPLLTSSACKAPATAICWAPTVRGATC
jgi:hypothetical protein